MKFVKKIGNRNKRQETYQKFQEEEKEKKNKQNSQEQYKIIRSRSSSTISVNINKTIHRSIPNNNKNVILKMNEMISDYPEKYYKQYLKSDLIIFLKNAFILLLHPLIILLYIDSATPCPKNIPLNECIERLDVNYYYAMALECFFCGILLSLYLVLIILRVIFCWHFYIILLELIIFISLYHENNIYTNGIFSFKLLLEFMGISFIFFLFLAMLINKLRRKQFFSATFFFFVSQLFPRLIY